MEIYKNLNLENIDREIWKEIEGFNGDYQISNFGRVKSFKRDKVNGKILKQNDNGGYLYVGLCENGKVKFKKIHVLMYEIHIEKIPEGYVIHHIDFTKNNILENLQMMTNGDHTILHHTGLKHSEESKELISEKMKGENNPMFAKHPSEETLELMREKKKGENHPKSILTEQDVIEIWKLLDEGILTQKEIGEKFGVCRRTISAIKTGKIWKHIKLEERECL